MTKKAALINRLNSLSETEKENIITFFNKHPVYENRVDWNSKTLEYEDFKKLFSIADTSKKREKWKAKADPETLFKGFNCRIIKKTKKFFIIMPLEWECAVFLNSFDCGGEGAKWCIGEKYNFMHWNYYISGNDLFYFICFAHKHPEYGKKVIFQYNIKNKKIRIWNAQDKEINLENSLRE